MSTIGSQSAEVTRPASAPISAEQMKTVLEVTRLLAVTTDLDLLLQEIAEATCKLVSSERASIFLHDPAADELWTKVALQSKEIRVPAAAGIVGHTFKKNEALLVNSPYHDPRFNPEPDRKSGYLTRNLLTAPMIDIGRKPIGVIQAINRSGGSFSESDRALIQLLADQAGVAIQRHRLQLSAMQAEAMRHEMNLARRVQNALFPKTPPTVHGLEAHGWAQPASITGGDLYDLWTLPDGQLAVFLADASGHGLAPTLVVSQVRTLVRALSETEHDPHKLLARVNARAADDLESDRFVTAFLGFISSDGMLRWSCAGHGPVLIRRAEDSRLEVLDACAPPLGVVPNWGDEQPTPLRLERGGSLIVMSDGIFEANNDAGEQFGTERVQEMIETRVHARPEEIIAAIRTSVRDWQGKVEPADDQTIVIVKRL